MWRRAEWVIVDGTFYPSLPPLIFVSWRALAPVGIQLEDRGHVSLAWMFFPGDPAAGMFLLACLFAGRKSWLVCSTSEMHTYVGVWSRDGYLADWLAGWLLPLLLAVGTAGQDGRMVETGRGCKVRRGLCLHDVVQLWLGGG